MSGYELTKKWYEWCGNNIEIVKPHHHALYFWCVEKCNRLGWADCYALPSDEAMHYLGMTTYKTYTKTLEELIGFGFITMCRKSTNQYTANIIALVKNATALQEHLPQHSRSTYHSTTEAPTTAQQEQSEYNKTNKNLENLETVKTTTTIITNDDVVENEVPDFVKEEQKEIKEGVATAPQTTLEEIEANMRNAALLKESAKRKNNINEGDYYQLLENFFIETRATDKKISSESDHKRHFLNWIRIQCQNRGRHGVMPQKGKIQHNYDSITQAILELSEESG